VRFSRHIQQLLDEDRGFLLRVEFLGPDGTVSESLGEQLVANALVSEFALSYIPVGGGRPHGQVIAAERWDEWAEGEVVLLPGHRSMRLTVGPIWHREHDEALERWLSEPHPWLPAELGGFHQGLLAPPAARSIGSGPPRRFMASWRSELRDERGLSTVGAMVLGPSNELDYSAFDSSGEGLRQSLALACNRMAPQDVFEELVSKGNGITVDWSIPFEIQGPTCDVVLARLMTRLRFWERPAQHLRELWLSAWPDTVDAALEEAAEVVARGEPDGDGQRFLALLQATHSELHPDATMCLSGSFAAKGA